MKSFRIQDVPLEVLALSTSLETRPKAVYREGARVEGEQAVDDQGRPLFAVLNVAVVVGEDTLTSVSVSLPYEITHAPVRIGDRLKASGSVAIRPQVNGYGLAASVALESVELPEAGEPKTEPEKRRGGSS